MAKGKKHNKKMTNSEYHKPGCVVRHISPFDEGDTCSHRGQGYTISVASRKPLYNSYDPKDIQQKDLPTRKFFEWIDRKGVAKSYTYEVKNPAVSDDPMCWHMGKPGNFQSSYKDPYLHNSHHILTNGELNDKLDIDLTQYDIEEGNVLYYLMALKYNINDGPNIVILPKEQKIGKIIKLPIHCPGGAKQHPKYSAYVGSRLTTIKTDLEGALKDCKTCEEREKVLSNLPDELVDLSGDLYEKIIAMGKKWRGPNIEQIAKMGAGAK